MLFAKCGSALEQGVAPAEVALKYDAAFSIPPNFYESAYGRKGASIVIDARTGKHNCVDMR